MSTLKMTMTPEWEADAILRTASKLTPDEFEAMTARVAKAIHADRQRPAMLGAMRAVVSQLDPQMGRDAIVRLREWMIQQIAAAEASG
jgi:hypothetical protein